MPSLGEISSLLREQIMSWYAPGSDFGFSKAIQDPESPNKDASLRSKLESEADSKIEEIAETRLDSYHPQHQRHWFDSERLEKIRQYLLSSSRPRYRITNHKERQSLLESLGVGMYLDVVC